MKSTVSGCDRPGVCPYYYYYEWRTDVGVSDGEFVHVRVGLERAENNEREANIVQIFPPDPDR